MVYAGILSGGIGTRMQRADMPKQFLELGDKPILIHTIDPFMVNPNIDEIIVALHRGGKGVVLSTENALTKPMDDETLRHLFDRFYRADASRSKESGGYGIGLSVAKAIAEKHGGSIRVNQGKQGRLLFLCSLRS